MAARQQAASVLFCHPNTVRTGCSLLNSSPDAPSILAE
jgi:hypothetical protein